LPFKAYCAELQRAIDAGKEIHRQKTELMWRSVEEQEDAIESGSRNTNAPSINTKKEAIAKLFNAPNEKRSYSEISADVELQSWKKRFQS
jgi:spore germination protein GerM